MPLTDFRCEQLLDSQKTLCKFHMYLCTVFRTVREYNEWAGVHSCELKGHIYKCMYNAYYKISFLRPISAQAFLNVKGKWSPKSVTNIGH